MDASGARPCGPSFMSGENLLCATGRAERCGFGALFRRLMDVRARGPAASSCGVRESDLNCRHPLAKVFRKRGDIVYTFAVLFFTMASLAAVWMLCVAWRELRQRRRASASRRGPTEFTQAEVRHAFEQFVAGKKAGGGVVRMGGLSVFLFIAVLIGGASVGAQEQRQERQPDTAQAREQESRERREAERRQRDDADRQPGVRCQRYHRRGKS
jgi:hypothetical protein